MLVLNGSLFFENRSLFFWKSVFVFQKSEFVILKIEVCFLKIGVCFFENRSLLYWKSVYVTGRRLSRPISVALSGYTVVTMLFNWKKVWHFSFKMALLLFLALNIVIGESVLPGYVPTLSVNVGLRSRVLVDNNLCQLFHLAVAWRTCTGISSLV